MRTTGFGVLMGWVLIRTTGLMMERFSGAWWVIETLHIGLVAFAILYFTRRLDRVEARLAAIVRLVREHLGTPPASEPLAGVLDSAA